MFKSVVLIEPPCDKLFSARGEPEIQKILRLTVAFHLSESGIRFIDLSFIAYSNPSSGKSTTCLYVSDVKPSA